MIVPAFTRQALDYRRIVRKMEAEGFMRVTDRGDPLWRLRHGPRTIAEARVGPDRKTVYIRLDPEPTP